MFYPYFKGVFCSLIAALFLPFAPVALAQNIDELPPARSFAGAYLAGRVASTNHDITAAINYFQQALSFAPDDEASERDLFLLLLGAGYFEQSSMLAHTLQDHPDVGRFARLVLALEAFRHGKWDEIKEDRIAFEPDVMDRLVVRLVSAWATLGKGEQSAALVQLEALSGPIWYDMFRHYNLTLILEMMGEEEATQAAFDTVLANREGGSASPDTYERAIMAYAAFKLAAGDRQAAIEILQQGEMLLSGRHVLVSLREKLMAGGQLPPLVSSAQEGAGEALYTIGSALNRSGAENYGRLYLQLALRLRPHHDATLFQLAELGNKVGAHDEAIGYYRQIKPESFYFRDANIRLALTLAEIKREEEAIGLLEQLLVQYNQDENFIMTLAGIYMQVQNFSAVAEHLTSHMEKSSNTPHWRLFYQRGIAYERLNMWDKAEEDFRAALRLEPEQPQVLNYLGYSLIDRNLNLDEALDMVAQAVSLRPQDGYIVDSLGWAYYKLGRYSQAVEELERAVQLRPEDATINDHLGDAYWRVGRRLEAKFQWNHAIEGKPEADELTKIEKKLKNGLQDITDTQ